MNAMKLISFLFSMNLCFGFVYLDQDIPFAAQDLEIKYEMSKVAFEFGYYVSDGHQHARTMRRGSHGNDSHDDSILREFERINDEIRHLKMLYKIEGKKILFNGEKYVSLIDKVIYNLKKNRSSNLVKNTRFIKPDYDHIFMVYLNEIRRGTKLVEGTLAKKMWDHFVSAGFKPEEIGPKISEGMFRDSARCILNTYRATHALSDDNLNRLKSSVLMPSCDYYGHINDLSEMNERYHKEKVMIKKAEQILDDQIARELVRELQALQAVNGEDFVEKTEELVNSSVVNKTGRSSNMGMNSPIVELRIIKTSLPK